jgi:hypothetical protein
MRQRGGRPQLDNTAQVALALALAHSLLHILLVDLDPARARTLLTDERCVRDAEGSYAYCRQRALALPSIAVGREESPVLVQDPHPPAARAHITRAAAISINKITNVC